jgi:hypothetical protein
MAKGHRKEQSEACSPRRQWRSPRELPGGGSKAKGKSGGKVRVVPVRGNLGCLGLRSFGYSANVRWTLLNSEGNREPQRVSGEGKAGWEQAGTAQAFLAKAMPPPSPHSSRHELTSCLPWHPAHLGAVPGRPWNFQENHCSAGPVLGQHTWTWSQQWPGHGETQGRASRLRGPPGAEVLRGSQLVAQTTDPGDPCHLTPASWITPVLKPVLATTHWPLPIGDFVLPSPYPCRCAHAMGPWQKRWGLADPSPALTLGTRLSGWLRGPGQHWTP